MTTLDLPMLVTALLGAMFGAAAAWFWLRSQLGHEIERTRSAAAVEIATLRERTLRVSTLEGQLAKLLEAEQQYRVEALRLTEEQAERRQSLRSAEEQLLAVRSRLEESDLRAAALNEELAATKESLARTMAELRSERELSTSVREQLGATRAELKQVQGTGVQLAVEKADLATRLDAERQQAAVKLELLNQAKEVLAAQFKALASDILEEKSKRFAEQNQSNLSQLLDPLKTKLTEFQTKVEDVYVKETRDRTALGEQVRQLMALNQSLSAEAKSLTQALKGSNKMQGNYGELVLERVLEFSGLRKGEEYEVQISHTREDGSRAQPDVVIRLPEKRNLVVDSKVSLVAYDESVSAECENDRNAAIARHIASVRAHIKGLSDKNYQSLYQLKSLDFVLMFIPIEPAFMLAVTHDRELFMEAWHRNVLLVSPSTLMFVVRTVAHLWRQEAQSRNAQEIAKRGAELYDRLQAFVADLDKVGERLRQAQDSFNDARDKLSKNKGNVIRQAEMLKKLGVKPTKTLPRTLIETAIEDMEEEISDAVALQELNSPAAESAGIHY